jgi:hypothetical protein
VWFNSDIYYGLGSFLIKHLYYWFAVGGEGTLQIHHLIFDFIPARPGILHHLPPPSYKSRFVKNESYQFFLEMGCSQPLHQLMYTAVILKSDKMVQVYK